MPYSVDAPGVDAPGLSSFAKESLPDFNNPISNAALGISAYNIARNLGVGLPSLGIPGMAINAALNAALQAERDRDVLGYTKTTIPGQIARSIIPGPLQRGILGQLGQLGPYQQAVYDKAPLSQLQDAAKQTQYQHMYTPEEQSLMSKSELGWDYDIADPDPSLSVAGVVGVKGVTMDSDELGLDNWSGPTTVDSETSYGYGVQDETDAEEGQPATDAQEDMDYDEDYGWNEGGLARKFGAVADSPVTSTDLVPAEMPKLIRDRASPRWFKEKLQQAADDLRAGRGGPAGPPNVTGYFEKPLDLPPGLLKDIPGNMGEESYRNIRDNPAYPKLSDLKKSIREKGYKPTPILIHVREDGRPFVLEGNHRIVEALQSGRDTIPVMIRYLRGGEDADGLLSPTRLQDFFLPAEEPRPPEKSKLPAVIDAASVATEAARLGAAESRTKGPASRGGIGSLKRAPWFSLAQIAWEHLTPEQKEAAAQYGKEAYGSFENAWEAGLAWSRRNRFPVGVEGGNQWVMDLLGFSEQGPERGKDAEEDTDDIGMNRGGYVGYDGGGFSNAELINEKLKRTYGDQGSFVETPFYSERRTPRTRYESINIPPGSMPIKGGIPVGIEVLQGYRKRLLTNHPAAVMERHNLKNQNMIENKQTSIKAKYKFYDVPDFMAKTLIKPEEVRASHTSSEEEVTNENAEKLRRVAKSFGVGTTFTLSPENLKALVNLDFRTGPDFRNISGKVDIPLSEDTSVNLAAQRNLIEGGQGSTSYDAGLNTKVFDGIGKLGINVRKTDQDNYIGGKLTFPLGPTPRKSTIEERHFYNTTGP